MKHIYLKILPEYYEAVKCGDKTFEVRLNDRDYQVNDVLHLQEFNNGAYTGHELVKVMVENGYGNTKAYRKDHGRAENQAQGGAGRSPGSDQAAFLI